jgi:hypothetical protein
MQDMPVAAVELRLRRAASKFGAEKHVLQVSIQQRGAETLAIELGVAAGERLRTNVSDDLDVLSPQHAQQARQLMRRVPDGPDCPLSHSPQLTRGPFASHDANVQVRSQYDGSACWQLTGQASAGPGRLPNGEPD